MQLIENKTIEPLADRSKNKYTDLKLRQILNRQIGPFATGCVQIELPFSVRKEPNNPT